MVRMRTRATRLCRCGSAMMRWPHATAPPGRAAADPTLTGNEGVGRQLIIVNQGRGRSSNTPWQNSSTHTRTAKSFLFHHHSLLSVERMNRRMCKSRRIEAPPGESPLRCLHDGSRSGNRREPRHQLFLAHPRVLKGLEPVGRKAAQPLGGLGRDIPLPCLGIDRPGRAVANLMPRVLRGRTSGVICLYEAVPLSTPAF
eukprot:scaffold155683_cov32-Tisochrysis_lutea.AAC.1